MTIVTRFPLPVREIENTWIPLSDGCRLAARIWLPANAEQVPVPAILEYLPYRKRDGTCERDELTYPYFAGHGYAGVRVDMRGNGESDGIMLDEYLLQEQDDALEVIEWLTRQPWCDGNVGMMGISWGGFNSLQVAARRPAALKAIISLCSTDNRYTDDIHYKGGALLMENLGWASTMLSYSSRPPDPLLRPDDWRETWLERLDNMPLLIEKWLAHPDHDEQWKHGSIDEDYGAIEAATLLIGGWHDAYSNTIPRMLQHLRCPRQGIIGPWAHKYPHFAVPGPRAGFLQIALRWWDRWLRQKDNGADSDPLFRAYVMDGLPPQPSYTERPGYWVAGEQWPPAEVAMARHYLGDGSLTPEPPLPRTDAIQSPADTGTNGGEFCIMWLGPDWPTDQRSDDASSLCFDSNPLSAPMALLGAPEVHLDLASDTATGQVVIRLCDVAEDDASTLITYGVLNLGHRHSYEQQRPMVPGEAERLTVRLDDCGYTVPAGHRVRVAVSTAHWPLLWPGAERTTLTLHQGKCCIDLPVYQGSDAPPPEMPDAITCSPSEQETLQPPDSYRKVGRHAGNTRTTVEVLNDFGRLRDNVHGLEKQEINHELHSIDPGDPLSARTLINGTQWLRRDDWLVRTETSTELSCDADYFYIQASLKALLGDEVICNRRWDTRVVRQPGKPPEH